MYRAPVSEISHTLMKVAGLEKALDDNRFPEFSADLAAAILEEAGKFASERVEPLRITGDKHGATVRTVSSPRHRAGKSFTATGSKAAGTR